MYCKFCGEENKNEANFCTYCGNALMEEEEMVCFETETLVENKIEKKGKAKLFKWLGVTFCVLGILIIFLLNPRIEEEEFVDVLKNSHLLEYYGKELVLSSLDIFSQEKVDDYTLLKCNIVAYNDEVYIDRDYEITCRKKDKNWEIIEHKVIEIKELRPRNGVQEPEEPSVTQISKFYPNVVWYDNISGVSRPIQLLQNGERHTSLVDKTDQIRRGYRICTNTSIIEGELEYNYIYDQGFWLLSEVKNKELGSEWDFVNRKYEFRVGSGYGCYYGAIYIASVDWEDNIAEVYYYGSSEQKFSDTYTKSVLVEFKIEDDMIKFCPFEFKVSWLSSGNRRFRFTITEEDIFYQWSYNEPSDDELGIPIGGVQ